MIRYRRLYESENSDIQMYDVVRCAGYEWYVIDIEDDIVTLLAKNADFGTCAFNYADSSIYRDSEIREYLENQVLPKLQNTNPIPTRLKDVGCTDKVWLLSIKEAGKLPLKIREFINTWWLRSPGNLVGLATVVDDNGRVDAIGQYVHDFHDSVRPAMRVHIEDLD